MDDLQHAIQNFKNKANFRILQVVLVQVGLILFVEHKTNPSSFHGVNIESCAQPEPCMRN